MAVGDILETVFKCQQGVQAGLNVRHYRVITEATGGATLTEIANSVAAGFEPLYQAVLSSSAQFRGVRVQKVRPLPMGVAVDSTAPAVNGLRTGDPLPRQTSGIITLRTALAGRANRGRAYIPFPAEQSSDDEAFPTATYIEALAAIGDLMELSIAVVGASGTTTAEPVIFRRQAGTAQVITSSLPRTVWATQRRRGDYGRPNPVQ